MRGPDPWWERATCRNIDPIVFEPAKRPSGRKPRKDSGRARQDWQAARAVCELCPVRQECLKDALAYDGSYEMFTAGHTPEELRQLRQHKERTAS